MPTLNYEAHGNPESPAVLLLHGFMSSNAQWMPNTVALGKAFFLITVELWGHGASPCPDESGFYSLEAYYTQFEAIRAELNIEAWSLIGQSYGAGIVMNYALAHQEFCRAVVATNSRSAFGSMIEERGDKRPAPPPLNLRELPYHPIHARRFPDAVKDALVASADNMSPAAVELGGRLGSSLNCRALVADYPLPLLITNGKYEKSFQQDLAALRKRAPDLNVIDLDGGHSVNIEAAEQFNDCVCAFLREHS